MMCSHQFDDLTSVKCQKMVTKKLPHCEHSREVVCHQDPALVTCTELCDQPMDCCSKRCKGRCGRCQVLSSDVKDVTSGFILRAKHAEHPCERTLYCQHRCGGSCHPRDQVCNTECKQRCRLGCIHKICPELCSVPCDPCSEACPWKCVHHECPVACGSVCLFLLRLFSISLNFILFSDLCQAAV